jgi:hypothetical protein
MLADYERANPVSTATKGRAFEYEIRNLLRSAGFSVIRGAGSKGEMLGEKVDFGRHEVDRAERV